ncbi:MAG: sodium:solute symporter family protein [Bacteroidota bacterium]
MLLATLQLGTLDWVIIGAYFIFVLFVGLWFSRRSGNSAADFFLSGRSMPWWLLGVSMVATTFSADTPNLVTDLVRKDGVAGNWGWWAFLLTGMLTVFVYAKLWRRSEVMTDIEFYELRYSGKAAAFLRGFRALYLGLVFNTLVMGTVSLAAVKFGEIMLGMPGWQTLLIAGTITLAYSAFGGLKAVIVTDFVQFILAMIGSIWACLYILDLDTVGGLSNLLADEGVINKLSLWPDFSDAASWMPILVVPLAVQWWASYYPGAEPGGGGYIAQRMFSAKDERNAIGATLLFNIAHYALRPWPWILIALASLMLFPMDFDGNEAISQDASLLNSKITPNKVENLAQLEAGLVYYRDNELDQKETAEIAKFNSYIQAVKSNADNTDILTWAYLYSQKNLDAKGTLKAIEDREDPLVSRGLVRMYIFQPNTSINKLGHDLGYPLMLTFLPVGLLGLVAAALIAAFMSTMSTQLNLGASYLVNDFYQRFIKPDATQKELVNSGRLFTVVSMVIGAALGLVLESAGQAFDLLLLLGAGTGLIYILRWFWWRINAYTEIVAMIASLIIAGYFSFFDETTASHLKIIYGALLTTLVWIVATFFTPQTDEKTLQNFYQKIRPGGPGWDAVVSRSQNSDLPLTKSQGQLPLEIACFLIGSITVYAALFATGFWIYGETTHAIISTILAIGGGAFLFRVWNMLKTE